MGSPHGNWSTHELIRLKRLFPRTGAKRMARLLGRTESSVRHQAQILFSKQRCSGRWNSAEELILRRAFGAVDLQSIAMILSRPIDDVCQQLARMRATSKQGPWLQDELALLKELYGTRLDVDLETCLSRSSIEISEKAQQLCLAKNKGCAEYRQLAALPRWTVEDIDTLRQVYPNRGNLEIARILDRSATSVANKAHKLGLKKSSVSLAEMGRRNVSIRYRG